MGTLATILRYELFFLLIALAVIVGYRLITQQINVKGLVMDKMRGRGVSPGRLQMLIVTMSIAIYYIMMVIEAKDTSRLPDMPNEYLVALGGSHSIYLLGKLYDLFAGKLQLAFPRRGGRAKFKRTRINK
jgi:hypothetical protein